MICSACFVQLKEDLIVIRRAMHFPQNCEISFFEALVIRKSFMKFGKESGSFLVVWVHQKPNPVKINLTSEV